MSKVRFKPYVGEKYHHSRYGIKLLVLGESHYHDEEPDSDFTTQVVNQNAFQPGSSFFTKLTKILIGSDKDLSEKERKEAWKHVAFYNYIQEIVGDEGRIAPTTAMWEYAHEPFVQVVRELKPDVILILGHRLEDQVLELPTELKVEWACIKHPSSSSTYEHSFEQLRNAIHKLNGVF